MKTAPNGGLSEPEHLVVAEALKDEVCKAAGITTHEIIHRLKGSDLAGTVCRHPFHGRGYDFDVPLLAAGFVDVETGSGFVHVAPGHGADDWQLAVANAIAVPETVDGGGLFMDHVALFAGKHVFKVNGDVIEALRAAGALWRPAPSPTVILIPGVPRRR